MISSSNKESFPSKFRKQENGYDDSMHKIKAFKIDCEKNGMFAPEIFKEDEHFWFTAMQRQAIAENKLKTFLHDPNDLKIASSLLALDEAEELLKREAKSAFDPLTNAWSRGALDLFLENLRTRQRKNASNAIMFLDIDHFGIYNKEMGHPEGDRILIELVGEMNERKRAIDMIGRYGGEEFVCLIVNLPADRAYEIVNKKAEGLRIEIQKKLGITVSIGTTLIQDSDKNITDIYRRASNNLLNAKNLHRNQVYSDIGPVERKTL